MRKRTELCPNTLIYKTPLILRFEPLSLSRLMRYIVPLFCFWWNFMILQTWKMHFTDEKHVLKSRKLKIRYKFPYFWKTRWFFFIANISKSLKNHVDFAQNLLWEMLEIASWLFGRLYVWKRRRQKTFIKPVGFWWFWLWM